MSEEVIASELRELLTRLGATFPSAPPPSEDTVRQVESKLGVRFPRSFRVYLRQFGAAAIGHVEIAGISDDPLTLDLEANNKRGPGFPFEEGLVWIASDGGDFSCYLETAKIDETGECPVVLLGPFGPEYPEGRIVAGSFLDWLRRMDRGEEVF